MPIPRLDNWLMILFCSEVATIFLNQQLKGMQKVLLLKWLGEERSHRKLLLIMKLTAFFLLILCLQVSARGHSQKISIKISRASLEKAFALIEKETNYRFVYSDD